MIPIIDLRSDTFTKPTPQMYKAICAAELGDDCNDGDPTVINLETKVAEILGKEAALFVVSGCMSNQIALAVHCPPATSILLDDQSHIIYYEAGSSSLISHTLLRSVPSINGVMKIEDLEKAFLSDEFDTPKTTLLCVENTHNRGGGTIIPLEQMRFYKEFAQRKNIPVHLDGARMMNAAVALGVQPIEIACYADSVSLCLSKGLRSPVGSVLAGSYEFIEKARLWRKRLGGSMRQAGILAACGIVSLDHEIQRLAEDHRHAKQFAQELQNLNGLKVDLDTVHTNIVMVHTDLPSDEWVRKLETNGIKCFSFGPHTLRFVFHADISSEMVYESIQRIKNLTVVL